MISIRQIDIRNHPQFSVMIVYHLCKLVSPEPVTKSSEPHEVVEIRWVKLEEIQRLITTELNSKVKEELGFN